MSKKMFKRSLALGALMAFVITGSAMAGTVELKGEKNVDVNSASGDRIVAGWSIGNNQDKYNEAINGPKNFAYTVVDGTYDELVGSNYYAIGSGRLEVQAKVSLDSTSINILNANAERGYIGGTRVALDVKGDGAKPTAVDRISYNGFTNETNVIIAKGTYGDDAWKSDSGYNGSRSYLTSGDVIKTRGLSGRFEVVNSNIKTANTTITTGTFNANVFGGSILDAYAYHNIKAEAVVDTTNLTINGGEFKENVYAGGAAYDMFAHSGGDYSNMNTGGDEPGGRYIKSNVGTANVKINGGNFADIYAGGLVGYSSKNDGTYEKDGKVLDKRMYASADVGIANIDIKNATVNNIYGSNGTAIWDVDNEKWDFSNTTVESTGVKTNLSLQDVTAKEIVLKEGSLTLDGANDISSVTIGDKVTVNLVDGDDYTGDKYAITGSLNAEGETATLTIGNIKETTYNIAKEYVGGATWKLDNDLLQVAKDEDGNEIGWIKGDGLQVTVEAKSTTEIANNLGVSEGTASLVEDIISNDNANAEAVQFVENVMNSGASKEEAKEAYAAMEKMAEAGGQSATAARIVNNVTGVTNDRLSFNCGHSAPHKGGHGVGLFEEGSGADIWVEYVHGKDKVEDMKSSNGASSYEGQYNGFVMGVDFKKVNKFQSGIALNYGEGDTNSVGSSARTHSDYDFWGVGYYGNIHNDDSNVIFDINYAKTDSDVTQNSAGGTLEASPETTTLSAGVKVEKLYQNENVQIVPYTGLRFMSIDTDDYATKGGGFMYNMERQNIWLLPVGVSIKQEIVNDNGWVVSPRVDLSYIWAFGDTNSNMEVKSGNGISPIWYDVMDDGSFLGLVGIEAHKGQWGYGVAYSYQKGDHSESKKWFIDVNYSF